MARNLVSVPVIRIKDFKYLFDEHINNQNQMICGGKADAEADEHTNKQNQACPPISLKKVKGERSRLSAILKKYGSKEAEDLITISKSFHREVTSILSTIYKHK